MSPGPAAVLTLADGRIVFVKAVGPSKSADLYRGEAVALALLPPGVPAATLLGTVDADGWVAVITSYAPGVIAGPPWTDRGIAAVVQACVRVAAFRAPDGLPPVLDLLPDLDGWAKLTAVDSWEAQWAPRLAEAVLGWREWTAGDVLVHHDLRADNAIVDASTGLATLVDWSFASRGAPWIDRALLAADVAAAGHVDGPEAAVAAALRVLDALPDPTLRSGVPLTRASRSAAVRPEAAGSRERLPGEAVPATALSASGRFVIGLAGMWRFNSTLADIPGMPTHRRWQRERAHAMRPLLQHLICRAG